MRTAGAGRLARVLLLVGGLAAAHLVATFTLGVLAFSTQGDLTGPASPSLVSRVVSVAVSVLEFPLVWLVRTVSPERLAGFTPAAVGNSLLWGLAVCWLGVTRARRRADHRDLDTRHRDGT